MKNAYLNIIANGIASITICLASTLTLANDVSSRFQMADGLKIYQIASDTEFPDCTCIAVDEQDRVYAAGLGYLRVLELDESESTFKTITIVTQAIRQAAQGMCVNNGLLHYVADNGIWEIQLDSDLTDSGKKPIKRIDLPTGGEHRAHAIRRGKDNHWYLIVGNDCDSMIPLQNDRNPVIIRPRAGMIWRFSDDWKQRSVVAHGLRNAYDFDFAEDGKLITYDSDGERDISLPWYRPTRVFEMTSGSDAGWVTRSWKRPNHDPLMPRVITELGRGSPTGVKRSSGNRLPVRFNDGTFVADWTFGRIMFVSDQGSSELVAQTNDYSGFAVTDIETLSDGRLIVSVGGRGSKGGIYLIDGMKQPTQQNKQPTKSVTAPHNKLQNQGEIKTSGLKQQIQALRSQERRIVNDQTAEQAIISMEMSELQQADWLEALALMIESVGGLGTGDPKDARGTTQVAPVFDGYRSVIRPKLNSSLIDRATAILLKEIPKHRSNPSVQMEMIRALAVLEPNRSSAIDTLIQELKRDISPQQKLHCLIAIARIPAKRNDDQTENIASEMLSLVRQMRANKMKTDRHWPIRLAELFEALQYRDSLLPSRIVAQADFGDPADLVWMEKMDPENLERARQRLLASTDALNEPSIASFIALGDDSVPRPIMRRWLAKEETRVAGLLALTNDARITDAEILSQEAWSTDPLIRQRVRTALERLNLETPERPARSETVKSWKARTKNILEFSGDVLLGSHIYKTRQCKKCHDGNRALGPRLEGVAKRFGSMDLLKAIYDPSHTIPDRYRSRVIITTDDQRLEGIPIYESVDGLTLVTATGETLRIEKEQIHQMKASPISTMPEGLMDGLTDKEVADLLSFLQSR